MKVRTYGGMTVVEVFWFDERYTAKWSAGLRVQDIYGYDHCDVYGPDDLSADEGGPDELAHHLRSQAVRLLGPISV